MSERPKSALATILAGPDGRIQYEQWLNHPVTVAVMTEVRAGFGTAHVPTPTQSGMIDPTAVVINHGVVLGVQGVLAYFESVPQVLDFTAAQERLRKSAPYQAPK